MQSSTLNVDSYCLNRAKKRLHNEYGKLLNNLPKDISVIIREDLLLEWHFLFKGMKDTPFEGGEYHGTLVFPENYPFSPPSIRFITPNGRFKTNEKVCFDLSDFHPECWKPAYTVSAVLQGVYSFMMSETTDTVGSLNVDEDEVRELAGKSREFNLKDGAYSDLIKTCMNYDSADSSTINSTKKNNSKNQDSLKKKSLTPDVNSEISLERKYCETPPNSNSRSMLERIRSVLCCSKKQVKLN